MENLPQNVAVVGCGDIGERLAAQLPGSEYRLLGLRRSSPQNPGPIRYAAADFQHLDSLARALPDACPVLVLTLTPTAYTDAGYQQAYVQGTENLINAVRRRRLQPRLVLFISSTSVYGEANGEWVDELTPARPQNFSGTRLLQAEQLLLESNLPVAILRCSGIYGPGRQRLLQRVWQGKTPTEANNYTNRIHADDCAAAIAHLIKRQARGETLASVYLASDNKPASAGEVHKWLAQQLGVATPPLTDAAAASGKRCRNQRLLQSGFKFAYPDYRQGYAPLVADFLRQRAVPHD